MKRICSGTKGKSCGRIIPANCRRCEACTRTHDAAHNAYRRRVHGSTAQRGYDSPWQRLSVKRRRMFPTCELRLPGCTLLSTEVDHVVPIRAGGRSTWENSRALCHSCHSRKTADDADRFPFKEDRR